MGENEVKKITIKQGEGLTYGLKRYAEELAKAGEIEIDFKKVNWKTTVDKLADIQNARAKAKENSIFRGETAKSTDNDYGQKGYWGKHDVVDKGEVEFTDTEMEELLSSMGVTFKKKDAVQTDENPPAATTNPTPSPEDNKEEVKSDNQPATLEESAEDGLSDGKIIYKNAEQVKKIQDGSFVLFEIGKDEQGLKQYTEFIKQGNEYILPKTRLSGEKHYEIGADGKPARLTQELSINQTIRTTYTYNDNAKPKEPHTVIERIADEITSRIEKYTDKTLVFENGKPYRKTEKNKAPEYFIEGAWHKYCPDGSLTLRQAEDYLANDDFYKSIQNKQNYETTVKEWKDTNSDSKNNVSKVTLLDGTKAYFAEGKYYKLDINGGKGAEMTEAEIKTHGIRK